MELIDQKTKKIMEECKVRAEAAGLKIHGETLEYIVTNRELIELSAKAMIPTLYDYWVHDVEVIRDKWIYDAYPHNPYETVINTRPAISFYNDNNPDWLNVMIFYHVLGHIDFFQNNIFFQKTWDDDFCGQALADKRLINRIREEMGAEKRWVDYVIEFARGIDNLVGYYEELGEADKIQTQNLFGVFSDKINFYFGEFLKRLHKERTIELKFYHEEVERYNRCLKQFGPKSGEAIFFDDYEFRRKFPEFNSVFEKSKKKKKKKTKDILEYLLENSDFLNKEKNRWMKDVLEVIRRTSLFFQPQIRSKISNEGWASFWHEKLFITDERIKGYEVDFAKVNSGVLLNPRIGFNPYIIGKNLFEFIEEMAIKGKLSRDYQLIKNIHDRQRYDRNMGEEYGKKILFEIRKNFDDYMLVNFLSDEDFQDFVDKYQLFVAGIRLSQKNFGKAEIYIKSRSGKKYREMLNGTLYHPPHVVISEEKAEKNELYLDHIFEGRTLVTKYIPAVLIGLSYLWGDDVALETTEFEFEEKNFWERMQNPDESPEFKKLRVLYTCQDKKIKRNILTDENED